MLDPWIIEQIRRREEEDRRRQEQLPVIEIHTPRDHDRDRDRSERRDDGTERGVVIISL